MTRAILLVDHGSRRPEANDLVEQVAAKVRERAPDRTIRIAHLELASPTIDEGVDSCVEAGADEIVVHPYFLGPGNHTTHDIPRLVAEAAKRHPGLRVHISEPLGLHESLIDVIMERVKEAGA